MLYNTMHTVHNANNTSPTDRIPNAQKYSYRRNRLYFCWMKPSKSTWKFNIESSIRFRVVVVVVAGCCSLLLVLSVKFVFMKFAKNKRTLQYNGHCVSLFEVRYILPVFLYFFFRLRTKKNVCIQCVFWIRGVCVCGVVARSSRIHKQRRQQKKIHTKNSISFCSCTKQRGEYSKVSLSLSRSLSETYPYCRQTKRVQVRVVLVCVCCCRFFLLVISWKREKIKFKKNDRLPDSHKWFCV